MLLLVLTSVTESISLGNLAICLHGPYFIVEYIQDQNAMTMMFVWWVMPVMKAGLSSVYRASGEQFVMTNGTTATPLWCVDN